MDHRTENGGKENKVFLKNEQPISNDLSTSSLVTNNDLKILRVKQFFYNLVVMVFAVFLLGAIFLGLNWRLRGEDLTKRREMLEIARNLAQEIKPDIAEKLSFTQKDKETPEFRYVSSKMRKYAGLPLVRGVYSLSKKNNELYFGPETYSEDDPMASPPGTRYEEPNDLDVAVFDNATAFVAGPYTDEYGTFVYALAPVISDVTGDVIMTVGIDILAEEWYSRLGFERKRIIGTLANVFIIAIAALMIGFWVRMEGPSKIKLGYWVFLPASFMLIALMVLGVSYQKERYLIGLARVYDDISSEIRDKFESAIDRDFQELGSSIFELLSGKGAELFTEDRLLKEEKLKDIFFEGLYAKENVLQLRIYDQHLRLIDEWRRGDRDAFSGKNPNLDMAMGLGTGVWSLENDGGGAGIVSYVYPLRDGESIKGYIEIVKDAGKIIEEFSQREGITGLLVPCKGSSNNHIDQYARDLLGEGSNVDLTDIRGKDDHRSLSVGEKKGQTLLFGAGGRYFFCVSIHLYDIFGETDFHVVTLDDATNAVMYLRGEVIFETALLLGVYLGILVLLGMVLNRVGKNIQENILELENRDEKLLRSNTMLDVTSNLNKMIAGGVEGRSLTKEGCRILAAIPWYSAAWICLLNNDLSVKNFDVSGEQTLSGEIEMTMRKNVLPRCAEEVLAQASGSDLKGKTFKSEDCGIRSEISKYCHVNFLGSRDKIYGVVGLSAKDNIFSIKEEEVFLEEIRSALSMALWKEEAENNALAAKNENIKMRTRIELVLGATRTGLCVMSDRTELMYVDPETVQIYGASEGKKYNEYFGKDAVPETERVLEKKEQVTLEKVFEHERERIFKVDIVPFKDMDGEWLLAQISSDITPQKQVESELKALFQNMMSAFAVFGSVFDDEGNFVSYRFIYINKAYEKITGVKSLDVKGKTVHEVWPNTEPEWVKRYGQVAVSGVPDKFDLYHDPTKKMYRCRVYRPGATKDKFCVVFDDITDLNRMEEEREKRMQEMEIFFKASIGREERIIELKREIEKLKSSKG